ncbi:MAG: PKD domain-containing protein [Microthrixaceae bacterium]
MSNSIHRRLLNRRSDRRGVTLLETIIAMVITSTVLLPSLGFVTLTMGEQATARTLTQETSNVAAADLALVRDISNAKAAASSTNQVGGQRAPGELRDCPAAPNSGAGGDVVLALVTSNNYRVTYSLAPLGPNPRLGRSLWRRTCPNQSSNADATLGDPVELNSPDATPTTGALLAQRIGEATSSCPVGDGTQDLECKQVVLKLQSVDTSSAGTDRTPVVIQATRRNTSYAAPNTPPNARFTWQPRQVEEGAVVTFDAAGSNDPRGGTLTYKWSFDAPLNTSDPGFLGSLITTDKTIPFRATSAQPPPMNVTLTVRNSAGLEDSETHAVDLQAKRPTASLLPNPPIVKIQNQAVQFTPDLKTYSAATISSATWDWGDGTPVEEACPPGGTSCTTPKSHSFTDLGTKIVKVTVVDSYGRQASAQVAVKIDPDTVFVATTGTDNGTCGIITSPCRQVDYGLTRAVSLGKPKVYVAGGTYNRFSARTDVEVVGGWNAAFTTQNATSTITGSASGEPYGILLASVQNASVKRFTVSTPTVSGATTQGVLVRSGSGISSKPVVLENITVAGGTGNQPSGMLVRDSSYVTLLNVNVTSPTAAGTGSSAYALRVLSSTVGSTNGYFEAQAGVAGADGTSSRPGTASNGCNGNSGSVGGSPGSSCGGGAGRSGWGNGWYFERGENGQAGSNGGGCGGSGGSRGDSSARTPTLAMGLVERTMVVLGVDPEAAEGGNTGRRDSRRLGRQRRRRRLQRRNRASRRRRRRRKRERRLWSSGRRWLRRCRGHWWHAGYQWWPARGRLVWCVRLSERRRDQWRHHQDQLRRCRRYRPAWWTCGRRWQRRQWRL